MEPSVTLTNLINPVTDAGIEVHESTISGALHRENFFSHAARQKPLVEQEAPQQPDKDHAIVTVAQWRKASWSINTKIELFGTNQQ